MNRLLREKSPYLRQAAHQKIDWYPWGEEAFERAREEGKPVFLSSGAIWCHWCHVMAKECFEDETISSLLNEHFISVKLDRDARPDIDRRYQHAVAAMGFGGGWPLSVFLTPEKKPFFGGTYFPPEDSHGRAGFKTVLRSVADFYASKKDLAIEYGRKVIDALKASSRGEGTIREEMVHDAVMKILSQFDTAHGGFGSAPKFPMPGAIDLLTNRFFLQRMHSYGAAVTRTLYAMAKGGFHDQLGGGFHRYAVDESWIIPHFEKMADDNAWLLRNYLYAYRVFRDEYFRDVAAGIVRFVRESLSAPEGGFYASQDADVSPRDEGGYFTWTERDFRAVLSDEEYTVLRLHLLDERGAMHHDSAKRVLFVAREPEEIASVLHLDVAVVEERIRSGKAKLLEARKTRESPLIDTTLYTSLNGLLITSFLLASNVLCDDSLKGFALKSLDRIIELHARNGELLRTDQVAAVLDDYVFLVEALIAAYEATGEMSFLERARDLMDQCIGRFWDTADGGFFDTESDVLGVRLKGIEDLPHPSANAVAIILLHKLARITGQTRYSELAERALRVFAAPAVNVGMHAASYFSALDAHFHMMTLTIRANPSHPLFQSARDISYPYLCYAYQADEGIVIPCVGRICYEPVRSPEELREFFRKRLGVDAG